MKKLAALLILAAACGPGLVDSPTVPAPPLGQTPGGGGPPDSPEICAQTPGTVFCGTQCVPLGPTNCGLNTANGVCFDCTQQGPGYTCSAGVCVPPTTCAAGLVVCASGCCTATQVVAGGNDSCAIVGQGATTGVYCWGANDSGQLGPAAAGASSDIPTEIAALRGASAVAFGTAHGCAIMADGTVKCWGANDLGQLGQPTSGAFSATPVTVPNLSGVTGIAAGDKHTCAITAAGVVCWGDDSQNQLGGSSAGTPVVGTAGAIKIAAGLNHTCADLPTSIVCWGANESGQLGNGNTNPTVGPVAVQGLGPNATSDIAAGGHHTCAIVGTAGTIMCWGASESFQIDATTAPHLTPTPVTPFGNKAAEAISAGRAHTCARRGGDAQCWGANALGQLANGAGANSAKALDTGLVLATTPGSLSAGGDHTCVIDSRNLIACFGRNLSKELGSFAWVNPGATTGP